MERDAVGDPAVHVDPARSLALASKAIALAPTLTAGYAARGAVRFERLWDWQGAREDFRIALALSPGDVTTYRRYGALLSALGCANEALITAQKVVALEPLAPVAWDQLAQRYAQAGRPKDSRQAYERLRALSPQNDWVNVGLGDASLLEGDAQSALTQYRQIRNPIWRACGVAAAEHTLAHRRESRAALEECGVGASVNGTYYRAQAYAWTGDREAALAALERDYAQHGSELAFIKADRFFASLREDPRFIRIIESMGFPSDCAPKL
jgi:tetratricopeptide (TPR) repeat protein